jgi:hypothetical protein
MTQKERDELLREMLNMVYLAKKVSENPESSAILDMNLSINRILGTVDEYSETAVYEFLESIEQSYSDSDCGLFSRPDWSGLHGM